MNKKLTSLTFAFIAASSFWASVRNHDGLGGIALALMVCWLIVFIESFKSDKEAGNVQFISVHLYTDKKDVQPFEAIAWPRSMELPKIGECIGIYPKMDNMHYNHFEVFDVQYTLTEEHQPLYIIIKTFIR